jgi:hypothetical protein
VGRQSGAGLVDGGVGHLVGGLVGALVGGLVAGLFGVLVAGGGLVVALLP